MKQQQQTAYNPHQSILFQIEAVKHRTPQVLAEEFMIFLSSLYGHKIETGDARLRTYYDYTMSEMMTEITMRLKMLRAQNKRAIERYKEKRAKEQEEALQEMMRFSGL